MVRHESGAHRQVRADGSREPPESSAISRTCPAYHADLRAQYILRGDLPLSRRTSVYATYGLQLDCLAAETIFFTGQIKTYTTTCDIDSPPNCTPIVAHSNTNAFQDYAHRDWHPAATVGFYWYYSNTRSLRLEYLAPGNGRVSALTAGVSFYW